MVSHTKYINNFYAKYLLALILASVLLFIANENLLAWILGAVCAFILDFHHFIIAIIIGGLISKNKPLLFLVTLFIGALLLELHVEYLRQNMGWPTNNYPLITILLRFLTLSISGSICMLIRILKDK